MRIEERTGWNLDDAALRFALGMAVRIVQSAQEIGTSEPSLAQHVAPADR